MKMDMGVLRRWAARNESFINRWMRRAVSLPFIFILWILVTGTLPLLLAVTVPTDLAGRQRRLMPLSRCMLFFLLYLNAEVLCLFCGFLIWLFSGDCIGINPGIFYNWNATLQRWYSRWLYLGACRIFSFSFKIEGSECTRPGPIVLLVRHASSADTPMSQIFVANPNRMMLRWVMKKELLWDPVIDIGANRLPNVFVDRKPKDRQAELKAIRGLATGMGPNDGVVIYPEGTRFSLKKLELARDRLHASGKQILYEKSLRMRWVLPPRPSGVLEIMTAAPEADAVFCAHTGFEGAVNFRQYLRGALVGAEIKVKYWRIRASEIPSEVEAKLEWLYDQWLECDRWIDENIPVRCRSPKGAQTR